MDGEPRRVDPRGPQNRLRQNGQPRAQGSRQRGQTEAVPLHDREQGQKSEGNFLASV